MESKNISLPTKCKKCNKEFKVSNDNTIHKKEFNVESKSIYLTYYVCPNCGEKYFVQIDDDVSLAKLKIVSKLFVKLSVKKHEGKSISKKQSANFKKIRKDLSDYRNKLVKEYEGKAAIDKESSDCFILHFVTNE